MANQYLFEPMAQQMAAARHELFLTAQKGVDGLNERLENNISVLPTAKKDLVGNGEVDGVISGLEELFHKDIGVQTSPQLESEVGNEKVESVGDDVVQRHASKLQELRGRIQSLLGSSKDVLEEDQATVSTFGDLQTYLEELAYEVRKPALSWENKYGAEDSGSRNHNTRPDEISKFKAEIRSVKGALLSARNFPSSGAGIIRIR